METMKPDLPWYPEEDDTLQPDYEQAAPIGPHIAVLLANGLYQTIPNRAVMALIEQAGRMDKTLPVALAGIKLNKGEHNTVVMEFTCTCNQPNCTRRLQLKGHWTGSHPAKFSDEVTKLAESLTRRK